MGGLRWVWVSILLIAACGGGSGSNGGGDNDAGMDADASTPGDSDASVASIDALPPSFSPCPPGWRDDVYKGAAACNPWPDGGRVACDPGQGHFIGEASCRAVMQCPAGPWPENLPSSGVIYVSAAATGQKNGTIDKPYSTLSDAVDAATAGDTIAVGSGDYSEKLVVDKSVRIVGLCPQSTVLTAPFTPVGSSEAETLFQVEPAQAVSVEGMTTVGGYPAFGLGAGAELTLENMSLQAPFEGVRLDSGSSLIATNTVFEQGVPALNEDPVCSQGNVRCFQYVAGVSIVSDFLLDQPATATLTNVTIPTPVYDYLDAVSFDGSISLTDVDLGDGDTYARISSATRVATGDKNLSVEGTIDWLWAPTTQSHAIATTMSHSVIGSLTILGPAPSSITDSVIHSEDSYAATRDASLAIGSAAVELERVVLSYGTDYGLLITDDGSVTGVDVVISNIGEEEGVPATAVGVLGGALTLERFDVQVSTLVGIQIAEGGSADLSLGQVRRNPVGINLQVEGYDTSRLDDRVLFVENGINIDSSVLPIPAIPVEFTCDDGIDNDNDGSTDCDDVDCFLACDR